MRPAPQGRWPGILPPGLPGKGSLLARPGPTTEGPVSVASSATTSFPKRAILGMKAKTAGRAALAAKQPETPPVRTGEGGRDTKTTERKKKGFFVEFVLKLISISDGGPVLKQVLIGIFLRFALLFVRPERIFERGKEIEEKTSGKTGDTTAAWDAAKSCCRYARRKGSPDAWYRDAVLTGSVLCEKEGMAPFYAEAAKRGHEEAVRLYVYRYYELRTRKSVGIKTGRELRGEQRIRRKEEKLFFRCCCRLASRGDLVALKRLAWCYFTGTGVKKDQAKTIALLKIPLESGILSEMNAAAIHLLISCYSGM